MLSSHSLLVLAVGIRRRLGDLIAPSWSTDKKGHMTQANQSQFFPEISLTKDKEKSHSPFPFWLGSLWGYNPRLFVTMFATTWKKQVASRENEISRQREAETRDCGERERVLERDHMNPLPSNTFALASVWLHKLMIYSF